MLTKNNIDENTKVLNHLIKIMYDSYEIDGKDVTVNCYYINTDRYNVDGE